MVNEVLGSLLESLVSKLSFLDTLLLILPIPTVSMTARVMTVEPHLKGS